MINKANKRCLIINSPLYLKLIDNENKKKNKNDELNIMLNTINAIKDRLMYCFEDLFKDVGMNETFDFDEKNNEFLRITLSIPHSGVHQPYRELMKFANFLNKQRFFKHDHQKYSKRTDVLGGLWKYGYTIAKKNEFNHHIQGVIFVRSKIEFERVRDSWKKWIARKAFLFNLISRKNLEIKCEIESNTIKVVDDLKFHMYRWFPDKDFRCLIEKNENKEFINESPNQYKLRDDEVFKRFIFATLTKRQFLILKKKARLDRFDRNKRIPLFRMKSISRLNY